MADGSTTAGSGIGSRRRAAIGAEPSTSRGRRTRALLLDGARTVFERDGFLDARVADIAAAAGTGHGSFYTYFDSKADVFRTLVNEVMETGLYAPAPRADGPEGTDGPRPAPTLAEVWRRIEEGNRRYLTLFRRDLALLGLFEQVAQFDDELRRYRLELRERSCRRVETSIRRLQDQGLADPALDPVIAAHALNSMVTQYVYYWLVLGQDHDEEESVATLTRLWGRSLGLDPVEG